MGCLKKTYCSFKLQYVFFPNTITVLYLLIKIKKNTLLDCLAIIKTISLKKIDPIESKKTNINY